MVRLHADKSSNPIGSEVTLDSVAKLLHISVPEAVDLLRHVRQTVPAYVSAERKSQARYKAIYVTIAIPLVVIWIGLMMGRLIHFSRDVGALPRQDNPVPLSMAPQVAVPNGFEVGIQAGPWSSTHAGDETPTSLSHLKPAETEYLQNELANAIVDMSRKCPYDASMMEMDGATHIIHVNIRRAGMRWMSFKVPVFGGQFPPIGKDSGFLLNVKEALKQHWKEIVGQVEAV